MGTVLPPLFSGTEQIPKLFRSFKMSNVNTVDILDAINRNNTHDINAQYSVRKILLLSFATHFVSNKP